MNAILNDRSGAAEERADRIAESWHKLGRWFPPATQVRIVTPLVPAYDPRRDLIGFYRFLLPAPTPTGKGAETVPSRPLGLLALRSVLDESEARHILLDGAVRVESLEYAAANRRELRRTGCAPASRAGRDKIEKVAIEFRESSADAASFRLAAFFTRPADRAGVPDRRSRPVCLAVEGIARASAGRAGRELAAVLAADRSAPAGP
jgi:hypothetical protein